MTQKSFFWDGATIGDANAWTYGGGYHASVDDYESPLIDIMFRMLFNGSGNQGVLDGWLNELAVTGTASPVQVDTGGAIVYGLAYENTAAVNVTVDTPTSEERIDRIVVRRDWAAQTARITLIKGVEGGGVEPALVQSPNTFYDIPLAKVLIDTAGNITLTDEREWCQYSTVPQAGTLVAGNLVNESVDLPARSTRTDTFFISAMDLTDFTLGEVYAPLVSYGAGTSQYVLPGYAPAWTGSNPPTWAFSATALTGLSTTLAGTFCLPDLFYGSTLTPYVWWTPNTAAMSVYLRSGWMKWDPSGEVAYGGSLNSVYVSPTYVVGTVYRTAVLPVTGLSGDEMVYYFLDSYNAAGTDKMQILGIEFQYSRYVP